LPRIFMPAPWMTRIFAMSLPHLAKSPADGS
jgi:hypothetical protein